MPAAIASTGVLDHGTARPLAFNTLGGAVSGMVSERAFPRPRGVSSGRKHGLHVPSRATMKRRLRIVGAP